MFVERQGRFSYLIKSSKKNRQARGDDMNVDNKEKKLEELIEIQTEEIEDLKLMLKETTLKLEKHERHWASYKAVPEGSHRHWW